MQGMPAGQVIVFFIGMILIIAAAYYVTYYIGAKATGRSKSRLKNRNISVIDRFAVARDKSFYLVEIAGKVYVIGATNQSMTLIDTLDAAAFSEAAAERDNGASGWQTPVWQGAYGGRYTGPMVKKLAAFMSKKMGRPQDANEEERGARFEESMKTARERGKYGQPDEGRTDKPESPEDEPHGGN